ncbi:MAG: glycosyltransferase family 2 protein [Abditibacteriota bacterium]|nr:glycosyltransferase family 2 protein [Abditibacteriota bacterium]
MNLSIICINWNSTDCVKNLLDSLNENPPSCEYEFILVDNASKDFDKYNLEYDNLTIIKNNDNLKYAKGNNQGIEIAKGEYILFLNPDIKVRQKSIDILLEFLENNNDYFGACPKLILPNGDTDLSIRGFPYPKDLIYDILKLNRLGKCFDKYRLTKFDYTSSSDVDQPMTSSLLVRKSTLDQIGSFDEDFPIFFNDVDLLYRAYKDNYKVRYIPESVMDHLHGASTGRADRKVMQYNSYSSLLLFFKKHFNTKNSLIQYKAIEILIKLIIKLKGLHP